jgi:hypothetical protein
VNNDPTLGRKREREARAALLSPRAYFAQASRAGATRAGVVVVRPDESAPAPPRERVFRPGDPALCVFLELPLPLAPETFLGGAVAMLAGARDGAQERLLIDLGFSFLQLEQQQGAEGVSLILTGTQDVDTYRRVLMSLRYINMAATPTAGARRVALRLRPAEIPGALVEVAAVYLNVEERAAATNTALPEKAVRATRGAPVTFNCDGDYTLFWWPQRRAPMPPPGQATETPRGSLSQIADVQFVAGGYRMMRAPARPSSPGVRPRTPAPPAPSEPASGAEVRREPVRAASDSAAPSRLRFEDIFGSDIGDAAMRRLIERRSTNADAPR